LATLCIALSLSGASAAVAVGATNAPKSKAAVTKVSFILDAHPQRKPGSVIPAVVKPANDAAAKTAPGVLILSSAMRPENPAAIAPAQNPRLDPAVVDKEPSLLSRMFSHLGSARRLTDEDAARYAHIFAFQDVGDFNKANDEIAKLTDSRLMGSVLGQRYLSPDYTATYHELAEWMSRYADHPAATRIADLAQKKKPKKGAEALAAPNVGRGVYSQHDFDVGQLAQPYIAERRHTAHQRDVMKAVNAAMSESPTAALRRLDAEQAKGTFDAGEYDSLRAGIASSYFYNGKIDKAFELAAASADRSGKDVPLAGWIGGLSAWQLGKYPQAAKYFETAAESNRTSAWMSAASAHWAARSYLRAHRPEKVSYWLHRSANYPRTFYGIISMKALGMEQARFNWQMPQMTDAHIKALSALPAGKRALALVDAERPDMADLELRQINPGDDETVQEAMLALANGNGMPGLSMRMGSTFTGAKGELFDSALYPDVPWAPERGFSVDRALVYAFIRQESKFEPGASNKSSGAIGLMQLMPDTARHVAGIYGDNIAHEKLQDPRVNIDLGQKYLAELLRNEYVDNNLFKLAVAYNAGPGKLARWEQTVRYADDPLLFIESIPVAETRIFVERVLANYWIYRIKYHQDTESLDKVAEGNWPLYLAQDVRPGKGPQLATAADIFAR